jgi:predicted nicotinamide N-methyase
MAQNQTYLKHATTSSITVADLDLLITSVVDTNKLLALHAGDDTFFPVGATAWGSGIALCDWLSKNPGILKAETEILEIGCGVGLLATWIAKKYGLHVCATDHDPGVEALVLANAANNRVTDLVRYQNLDWSNAVNSGTRFPIITGSDIIYDKDSIQPIMILLKAMLSPNGQFITCNPLRYRYEEAIEKLGAIFCSYQTAIFPMKDDRNYVMMIGQGLASP